SLFDFVGASHGRGFEGFLRQQNAGDDVLPGMAAEFLIALAAGDVSHPLMIGLDAGELGPQQIVVDRLAVDYQAHQTTPMFTKGGKTRPYRNVRHSIPIFGWHRKFAVVSGRYEARGVPENDPANGFHR